MIETARFSNPFDTHQLCIKPFLDAVDSFGSLGGTIRAFRAFDRQEVAPRVRPEKMLLHRTAVSPLSLWLMGVNEVAVKRLGVGRSTYEDVIAIHTVVKRASRRIPKRFGGLVHAFDHETSCEGVWGHDIKQDTFQDEEGGWHLGIRTETINGPFSSCE